MKEWLKNSSGNVGIVVALLLPLVLASLAGAVDYAHWLSNRADVQSAADTAALAAAKEMRLGNSNPSAIIAAARSRAVAALGSLADDANIQISIPNNTTVSVQISVASPSLFGDLAPVKLSNIQGLASAQSASTPTCLITLDPKGSGLGINTAAINANSCATYSDAQKSDGLNIKKGSLTAFQSCSAGGAKVQQGFVSPPAIMDCPVISDPLISRQAPAVGNCSYSNLQVNDAATLYPGTYCGGLTITNGATATLSPGVYIITGGKFTVNQNATLQGNEVGFFLAGDQSQLDFDINSNINLVAPSDGPMAGILFFEDRNATPNHQHVLASRNAPQLLGTLYFPEGQLSIGGPTPGPYDGQLAQDISDCAKLNLSYPCSPPQVNIASYSAWTIIIANDVNVNFVVNLVLNTNYSASSTKPPSEISMKGASLIQ
jgi:Flp pilus assembly protein TadG